MAEPALRSYRAKRGTMREYETVFIVRPELNQPKILDLAKRLVGVLDKAGGRVLKVDSWGTRILAYPIAHCRKGIYLYWRYLGGSDTVAEFERNLRNLDAVIRYQTVKIDEDIVPDARPSEVTEDVLAQAADPGPDPEELARKRAEAEAKAAAEAAAAAETAETTEEEGSA
ncbi:MAG: 30S ribosomal protein S6 [Deltaproteobacteria bacterium]|nr:MAG: 30S ribosomal protein S6 [Deltaproteobacteria bacterium]